MPRCVAYIDWRVWRPVDVATLLFVVENERILLIRKKRGLGAGKINGPGGRVEDGESTRDCAVRETREELCIDVEAPRWVAEHRFQFADGYALHVDAFVANGYSGVPTETDEAVPLWFALDDVPYDEMWADDRVWLPRVLAGQCVSGRYTFDGDALLDYAVEVLDGDRRVVETLRPT